MEKGSNGFGANRSILVAFFRDQGSGITGQVGPANFALLRASTETGKNGANSEQRTGKKRIGRILGVLVSIVLEENVWLVLMDSSPVGCSC
jgi:hypothetical protein